MWLIYFDASFSNFKIGKICWNSSRIWTQIPHKWYWNHPLPAFREVLLISFHGLRVEWEMSARSESAGEARPLLPFICVHQFRPHWALLHWWIPEQTPHLHSISCSSGPGATPGAPNTELMGSKTFLCSQRWKWRWWHLRRMLERELTLTHLHQPTRVLSQQSLCPKQWNNPTQSQCHCLIQCGDLG